MTVQRTMTRSPAYAGTVIWALAGIMVANRSDPLAVTLVAGTGMLVLAAQVMWQRRARA